jgi:DNA-directed RNA polymerase subunit M/transcription elongation factor TFIIS
MENRFKGIKFCPDCSNMLKATEEEKSLIFQCRYCNYREKIEEGDEVDI